MHSITSPILVLLALQPAPNANVYALSTAFLEFGELHENAPSLVPIQYGLHDQTMAATGESVVEKSSEPSSGDGEASAPKTASTSDTDHSDSIEYMLGVMTLPLTNRITLVNAIHALGSITFACSTTIASRVGLTWDHFRELLGSSYSVGRQDLLRQWLHSDLTNDPQSPCWLIRATCLLLSKLTNASWSSAAMRNPRSNLSCVLTAAERGRLGPVNVKAFAAVEHLGGWVDYLVIIPDNFTLTKAECRGSLSATLAEEKEGSDEFVFRARSFYTTGEWATLCKSIPPALDHLLIAEVNLFISSVVLCARRQLCHDIG